MGTLHYVHPMSDVTSGPLPVAQEIVGELDGNHSRRDILLSLPILCALQAPLKVISHILSVDPLQPRLVARPLTRHQKALAFLNGKNHPEPGIGGGGTTLDVSWAEMSSEEVAMVDGDARRI